MDRYDVLTGIVSIVMVGGVFIGGHAFWKKIKENEAEKAAAQVELKREDIGTIRRKVFIERVEKFDIPVYRGTDDDDTAPHDIEIVTAKDGERRIKLIYPNLRSIDTGVAILVWKDIPQGFITLDDFVREYISPKFHPKTAKDKNYAKSFNTIIADGVIVPYEQNKDSIVYSTQVPQTHPTQEAGK